MVPIEVELAHLKGSVGLILAKASAMRISIPHRPVYAALHTLYSFTCSLNEHSLSTATKQKQKKQLMHSLMRETSKEVVQIKSSTRFSD
jgi:hypothetical protein